MKTILITKDGSVRIDEQKNPSRTIRYALRKKLTGGIVGDTNLLEHSIPPEIETRTYELIGEVGKYLVYEEK